MRRALFSREFRSALIPNLVTVGAILGTLVTLEKFYGLRLGKTEDVRAFIELALLAGLVLSGFISGERCFPAELKESRMLFLASLPISRTWTWLAIVSARLLAGLVAIALAVALRSKPWGGTPSRDLLWLGIAIVPSAYIFFFSAGTLFALLFRRTFVSYVAGFVLLGFLLIETLFSSSYATNWPMLEVLSMAPLTLTDTFDGPLLAGFLSLFLFSSLLLSWRFFVRGEISNRKRWIRNQFLFGIIATAYLGFVFCTASSTKLASAWRTWEPLDMDWLATYENLLGVSPYGVSPNGKYLFVFEMLHGRPFIIRVNIVDTQTGRVTYRSVYGGVRLGFWSSQGDVLNLLILNNSPLDRWGYLVHGTVDWIRLSPEGREISKLSLKGLEDVEILSGGRALAVLREGALGRINLLDGTSGQSSEIVRAPLDGSVTVRKDGPGSLVYFDNFVLPRRTWVIDSLANEIQVPQSSWEPVYFLFGEALRSPTEVQTALLRRFASPLTPEGTPIRGSFLLPSHDILSSPDQTWILPSGLDPKAVYFLEERVSGARVLWVRSTAPKGQWEKLPDIAPNPAWLPRFLAPLEDSIDFPSGTSAFLATDGDTSRFFIYDPQFGVSFEAESCAAGNMPFLTIDRVLGLRGVLIGLTCTENVSSGLAQQYFFEYLPGSRHVRTIKSVPVRPLYARPLYLDKKGWEVWMPGYDTIEIWRSSPEAKDLRLWPTRDYLPLPQNSTRFAS